MYAVRGNVRSVTTPGDQACFQYDVTGTLRNTSSNAGSASYVLQAGRNNSVPGQITANGFTSTAQWDVLLRPGSQSGPNGDTVQTGYDAADRPASVTSPTGEVTNYQYSYTSSPPYRQATTRAAWVKTYLDGFGRPVRTDAGHGTDTVVSRVLTEYDACACSPLGKVKKVSRPHLPGQVAVYTEYEYDAMGRTVKVKQPPNSGQAVPGGTETRHIWVRDEVAHHARATGFRSGDGSNALQTSNNDLLMQKCERTIMRASN